MRAQQVSALHTISWGEALRSYATFLKSRRAEKTVLYHTSQLTQLIRWAEQHDLSIRELGKRAMDDYLAFRAASVHDGRPLSKATLHHDAVCAKCFLKWCARNDVIERNLLADFEVPHAPRKAMYFPTKDEMTTMVASVERYWDPVQNPGIRHQPTSRRTFMRDRTYTMLVVLIDSCCRIGEILNLKVADVKVGELEFTVTESKGKEPRTLPMSIGSRDALVEWLKVRKRIMRNLPPDEEDEGWLFISETGGRVDYNNFLRSWKNLLAFCGLDTMIRPHSTRRYGLNKTSKKNPRLAQQMAGHKHLETTMLYAEHDPDFIRTAHAEVGLLDDVLTRKTKAPKRRLV